MRPDPRRRRTRAARSCSSSRAGAARSTSTATASCTSSRRRASSRSSCCAAARARTCSRASTIWLDLFHGEFFAPRGRRARAHVDAFLDHFERARLARARRRTQLRATEKGAPLPRVPRRADARGCSRATTSTFGAWLSRRAGSRARALEKRIGEQFERAALLGEIALPEANNPVTFGNALDLLIAARRARDAQRGRATATRCSARPGLRGARGAARASGDRAAPPVGSRAPRGHADGPAKTKRPHRPPPAARAAQGQPPGHDREAVHARRLQICGSASAPTTPTSTIPRSSAC